MNSSSSNAGSIRGVGEVVFQATLFAGALVMLYPLIWMIGGSLKPETEIFSSAGLFSSNFTADNYVRGWGALEVPFGRFMWNSTVIALITIVGTVLSCSLAAFAFAILRPRGARILFAVLLGS